MVCFYNGGAPPLIVVLCATDSKILVLYLFHWNGEAWVKQETLILFKGQKDENDLIIASYF